MPVLSLMRVLAATGVAIALAAIAGAAEAREASIYRGPCGQAVLPKGPLPVEAAIRVQTKCGAFAIDRDGVRYLGKGTARPSWDGVLRSRDRLLFGVSRTLASLAPLRLGRPLEIVPLEEGRVALVGRRVVVLGPNGAVVASDRRRGSLPALSSNGAIALISTSPLDERGRARESVRLLRPGERSSTPLVVNEVGALGCGHWPSLEWRGDELLYSTTAGDVVVIDPGSRKQVDLTSVVRRLPGEFVAARWA